MKLIVGLGNPGKEYEKTRHNVGFQTIDMYASRYNEIINKSKFSGLYTEININNEKVILLKPQSYINLSGEVIRHFVDFFKIDIDDILIISDDLDLDIGSFKIKPSGSSGGHNGLKNIELHLGTQKYRRIKIGISNDKQIDTWDYVLGKITKDEDLKLTTVKENVINVLDDYFKMNFDLLMNKYNAKIKNGDSE